MMTRGVLGIVAVTLLWCTSFALLDAQVVKYVKTPAQGAIRTQCDAAISYTKESRADYEKCVNVQVDKCDATYVARLTDTAKTSFDAQKHNVLVLNDLTANVGTCTNTLTLALQLIDEWVAPAGQVDQANKDALNAFGYNSHLGATCAGISGTIGHSADSTADSQVAVAGQREAVYELAYQVCEGPLPFPAFWLTRSVLARACQCCHCLSLLAIAWQCLSQLATCQCLPELVRVGGRPRPPLNPPSRNTQILTPPPVATPLYPLPPPLPCHCRHSPFHFLPPRALRSTRSTRSQWPRAPSTTGENNTTPCSLPPHSDPPPTAASSARATTSSTRPTSQRWLRPSWARSTRRSRPSRQRLSQTSTRRSWLWRTASTARSARPSPRCRPPSRRSTPRTSRSSFRCSRGGTRYSLTTSGTRWGHTRGSCSMSRESLAHPAPSVHVHSPL